MIAEVEQTGIISAQIAILHQAPTEPPMARTVSNATERLADLFQIR
jgi:hypothetical protein